jgi:predicted DNA-binding transcriptional regulator AlpA
VLTVSTVVRYLTITEFAKRAGLSPNTLKSYSHIPGRIPEPDAVVGRIQGWLPETVDEWIAKREARRTR